MGRLFNLDSPFMRALNRVADVLIVNLLTCLFFIPLFAVFYVTAFLNNMLLIGALLFLAALPVGAAFTAMHYVLLKLIRGEEGYIARSFFRSCRDNFLQATGLWAGFLIFFIILGIDLYMATHAERFPQPLKIALVVALIIITAVFLWTFPLLSHFVNTNRGTLKNAVIMTVGYFPRTLGMIALSLVPLLVLYVGQWAVMPLLIMFGIAGPAYGCCYLYSPAFKRFEPEPEDEGDPDAMPAALRDEPVRDEPQDGSDTPAER
ncbi:YesL family protein [Lachnoclostridium sp. Marseille-P6806]|uniref:YesL family protein n=1 Tax=Lachnoclostridium sp. Marseille-P6806 TaxID=2364793 RepID=UPI001031199C|nr:DUF624 domain-containing protein [Lachnoclostridium sp. Marseille-P6806]